MNSVCRAQEAVLVVLFGGPLPERAARIGTSERMLYRRIAASRDEGKESLFSTPKAKRRKIVDLKAEHPR